MATRVLALLAAVAMVVGAVYVRDQLDDRTEQRTTTLRLVCSSELAAVCESLAAEPGTEVEITVEPAATTADRLIALAPGQRPALDGWLVPGPWPAIVEDARKRLGRTPVVTPGRVLARSPLVLAVWPDRAQALATRCQGGTPGWKCIGEVAGQPWATLGGEPTWGPVKPGHPDPSSATGLAVLGTATAAYFGRPDLDRADLEDPDYVGWLSNLERSIPSRPVSPLRDMIVKGPSAFDAVGTIEAEAGPLLAASARNPKPTVLYPSPVATADVVLGTAAGRAGQLLAELVSGGDGRRALAESGWLVAGQKRAAGVPDTPDLPPGSGLPSPGLLAALREVVAEANR